MSGVQPLPCFFVSDLHGRDSRFHVLFNIIAVEKPAGVFLGGDLLPSGIAAFSPSLAGATGDFLEDVLLAGLRHLKVTMGNAYPQIFVILGNDDGRFPEPAYQAAEVEGLWTYVHERTVDFYEFTVTGYSYVPPTPFRLKDWERYDVSRFVDPGCVSPEEGSRTVDVESHIVRYATIAKDLDALSLDMDQDKAMWLFHSPPYKTALDRAALDGQLIDHVPLDVHVGSIAIQRFINKAQPLLTLHGHIHESARLTGKWSETIGSTVAISGCHDGSELALVRFDPRDPAVATRELVTAV
ncbi:metallophosphoesterase [bacterium]|nr:metallophosphoesterase [bacterium]